MMEPKTKIDGPEDQHQNSLLNPLCIILVKNGSKGDRLLFRYPYKRDRESVSSMSTMSTTLYSTPNSQSTWTSSSGKGSTGSSGSRKNDNPRSRKLSDILLDPLNLNSSADESVESEELANQLLLPPVIDTASRSRSGSVSSKTRKVSLTSRASPFVLKKSPGSVFDKTGYNDVFDDEQEEEISDQFIFDDGKKMLDELSDKDLSNLLAVGNDLSERKFELKLNYLRFVGHPTLMQQPKSYRPMKPEYHSSVKLFHVVFCLSAVASHSIVKCFHDLSKRIGIALRHEEYRCGYLSEEIKKIVTLHDQFAGTETDDKEEEDLKQENMFNQITARISLAQLLKRIYEDIIDKGCTFVRVNDWVQISFCLPQKIHSLPFRENQCVIEPEAIHKCLEAIRPYHAILLIVEVDDLLTSLWLDAAPTISRLLHVYSPLKSLQTLAADADLTLNHVCEITSHLVYWGQATVIYPLCYSNVYVVSPDFPMASDDLRKEFSKKFPGQSLTQVLSDFSVPMPLGDRLSPVAGGNSVQNYQVQLVTWLLKYHLLRQVYWYIYLVTYFDGNDGTMFDTGVDFVSSFMGDFGGPGDFSLIIKPFEMDEDDADVTASDTFSETTEETGQGNSESGNLEDLPSRKHLDSTSESELDSELKYKNALSEVSDSVRRAVSMVKVPLSIQDIKMFQRLSKYFKGNFHMEEIMYRENVRRSQLMLLLDKFRDALIIVEKEDPKINFFNE